MSRATLRAVYEKGVLRPQKPLSLPERQEVLIIVLPLPDAGQVTAPAKERMAQMRLQVEAWLAHQPADAVRAPLNLSSERRQVLAADFDAALAEIRARAAVFAPAEIAADVEAALAEVRPPVPVAQAQLEQELDAILSEVAADVLP